MPKTKKIVIDQDKCIGCGLCINTCPDLFRLNDQGKSEVIGQGNTDCAQGAAAGCPVSAITVD